MKRIAWVGFGWLAQIMSEKLALNGIDSIYFNRSVKQTNFNFYPFNLNNSKAIENYSDVIKSIHHLIFTIPPSTIENYVEYVSEFLTIIHKINPKLEILFCSSISVYGNQNGMFNENDKLKPISSNAKQLARLEEKDFNLPITFIRLGGLVGPNRHPIKFLQGRVGLSGGSHPINLIHSDEIFQLIVLWLNAKFLASKINLVNPSVMKKKDYYGQFANRNGFKEPSFTNDTINGKKVSSMILKELNFDEHFLDPLEYSF